MRRKRIAVISGASSGMGRIFAMLLAERLSVLSELWLIGRRSEELSGTEERIRRLRPELSVRKLCLDLCEEASFSELSGLLREEKPEILFLVNAAGFGKLGDVEALPEGVQADMIRLNAEAPVRLTRLCLPWMKNRKGRIVNFASAAAFLPQPGFSVYAATKAFLLSFSESLAEELKQRGRSIPVTAVCPGPVRTDFFDIAEEFESRPVYKKLLMADAIAVCEKAFLDSLKGRRLSVYGASMQGFRLLCRLLPHSAFFFCIRLLNGRG